MRISVTDTVISTAVNGVLWYFYLFGASIGKSSPRGMYRMFREADEAFSECNYQHFKAILSQLTKDGSLNRPVKRGLSEIQITEKGVKRLGKLIPTYNTHRPWDGEVFLVSYDIPESSRSKRNTLRIFLQRVGCAKLQESMWLTVYSPQKTLDECIEMHHIPGVILVSRLDNTGVCGDETFVHLISRIYQLDALQDRYTRLKGDIELKRLLPFAAHVAYMNILKDDPQLPRQLLPDGWLGDEVYEMVQRYTNFVMRPHQ